MKKNKRVSFSNDITTYYLYIIIIIEFKTRLEVFLLNPSARILPL